MDATLRDAELLALTALVMHEAAELSGHAAVGMDAPYPPDTDARQALTAALRARGVLPA